MMVYKKEEILHGLLSDYSLKYYDILRRDILKIKN